jgi:hypothetical protein
MRGYALDDRVRFPTGAGIFSLLPHLMASQIGAEADVTQVMRVCAETQEKFYRKAFVLIICLTGTNFQEYSVLHTSSATLSMYR